MKNFEKKDFDDFMNSHLNGELIIYMNEVDELRYEISKLSREEIKSIKKEIVKKLDKYIS